MAILYQHRNAPVRFDPPPDPREQVVTDPYPAPSVVERAKAAQLCARADALDQAQPEHRATLLKTMDKPSFLELQAIESRYIETVAEDAATLLYARPLDRLDRAMQAKLRDNAAVFVRSRHDAWVRFSQEMAVMAIRGLLQEDLAKALPHLNEAHWHGLAIRCVARSYGAMRNALASINGMAPGTYLRLHGRAKAEDASRA